MRGHGFLALSAFLAFLLCSGPVSAPAGENTRYGPWQTDEDRLEQLIDELKTLIDEGRRSRAAHPAFLLDLEKIINSYRRPRRLVWLREDFSDGDYRLDPAWEVRAGDFTVDRFGSLHSAVPVRRPDAGSAESPGGEEASGLDLMFGVLRELSEERKPGRDEEKEPAGRAVILTRAEFPNSFTVRWELRSEANWGSTEIGIFQGDRVETGYRLVYQAAASGERPMQLFKYRGGKRYLVDAAGGNTPDLDDGAGHVLVWERNPAGEMVVTVDDTQVLRVDDLSYRDPFSGLVVVNNGGTYGYDNIEVFSLE